jgi:7-cyano-7-deazaguanine synthase
MTDHRLPTTDHSADKLAVLASGGIDSAVLLAEARFERPAVHPVYVRTGVVWESAELAHLTRFLEAIRHESLRPLVALSLPMDDIYGRHWSMTGENVPDERSPDEAVYLPGWNVALLAKALIWCHLNAVGELAIAPLAGNPFRDATADFFAVFERIVNQALGGHVKLRAPYTSLSKRDILLRARDLPLELTFSCIRPLAGRHCGRCNKCAERQAAFAHAKLRDPTDYAAR